MSLPYSKECLLRAPKPELAVNKLLQLPVEIRVTRYEGDIELAIAFQREALRDWCLSLCLIKARNGKKKRDGTHYNYPR